ncbi:MAG TPA: TetR/AcrR family transcriptional regulator [Nakamurella sp.]|nr:TetR/AcrR family transcriptional regulator [Nakamurella sp.]
MSSVIGTAERTPAAGRAARRAGLRPDGTPARVTKRRAETRSRLLQAATTLFAERGFGQVSIEQICGSAGYTRGAFYSNFDSVDELYFALYQERASMIAEQVAQSLTAGAPAGSIPALVDRVVSALMVDRQWIMIKTDFLLHAARSREVAAVLAAHHEELREALAAHLSTVVDVDGLPPALRTTDGLARAVGTIHDGAMLRLLLDPDDKALRRWLRVLLIALLDHSADRQEDPVRARSATRGGTR